MSARLFLIATIFACFAAGAQAQPATPDAATSAPALTDGEVRKVDKDAGKVTLRHGPIANLGMPGMTMVFKAADPALLEMLKEGDHVRFTAERANGAITLTHVEPAP